MVVWLAGRHVSSSNMIRLEDNVTVIRSSPDDHKNDIRPSVIFHIFRFTAYNSYPIELKLSRMILDISLHKSLEPKFSISSSARCGGVLFEFFKSIHSLQLLSD